MMFDCTARNQVFEYLVANGYTGDAEPFWDEMRRQSYLTEIRLFRDSRIIQLLASYPTLKPFVDRVIPQAAGRFDSVRTDRGYGDAFISFNDSKARRQEVCPTPLRIEGVTLDFDERDGYCEVRVRTYVNNEFRRDKYFRFPAKEGNRQ
jgi:hypothetical protein